MKPEILIEVRFKTEAEGGKTNQLYAPFYPCPMVIDGMAFDCRILLEGKLIKLGQFYELPVKFLDYDNARKRVSVGKKFSLLEGREVAIGIIKEIL